MEKCSRFSPQMVHGLSITACADFRGTARRQADGTQPAACAETIAQVVTRHRHHIVGRKADYAVVRTDIAALKRVSTTGELGFEVENLSASRALSHYSFSARVMRADDVVDRFKTQPQAQVATRCLVLRKNLYTLFNTMRPKEGGRPVAADPCWRVFT